MTRSFLQNELRYHCPVCDGRFNQLLPFGKAQRPNVKCPRCGSAERHRLVYLYLRNETNFFRDKLSVCHFAAEPCFYKQFKSLPNLDYVSCDMTTRRAMLQANIRDLPFKDKTFDVILCLHVLEHVTDDVKAMQALRRVLKPGGWAILQVPVGTQEKTLEDFSLSPEQRKSAYGREEHVRLYGRDYPERLKSAGFQVRIDDYLKTIGSDGIQRYRINQGEKIYYCSRL